MKFVIVIFLFIISFVPHINPFYSDIKIERKVASQNFCDEGNFDKNNCYIQNIKIDKSCESIPDKLKTSINEIKETSCLEEINKKLDSSLKDIFFKKESLTICCNKCADGNLPQDEISNINCANTTALSNSNKSMINLNLRMILSNGYCGKAGFSDNPISSNLFHEMLHVSGIQGTYIHQRTAVVHPEIESDLVIRDFEADPIFGCEKMCFGKKNHQNAINCAACSGANTPESGGSNNPLKLMTSLRNAELSLENNIGPKKCLELANADLDPIHLHAALFDKVITPVIKNRKMLSDCVENNMKVRNLSDFKKIENLDEYKNRCFNIFEIIKNACEDLKRLTNCKNSYYVDIANYSNICKQASEPFTEQTFNTLSLLKSTSLLKQKGSLDCDSVTVDSCFEPVFKRSICKSYFSN